MLARPQAIALGRTFQEAHGSGLASQLAVAAGRPFTKAVSQIGSKLPRSPTTAALGVSLVVSALVTAAALRLPGQQWLSWISFLPLFVVVRSLRPPTAALAGGFWGACLYLFWSTGPTPAVDTVAAAVGPSAALLASLTVIPAVYIGLAALPARPIGCKLLTLALGWTLVEVVVCHHNHFGPREALLTDPQAERPNFHWLVRLFGYVSLGFVVACVNASLLGILSGARLRFPACRSLAGSAIAVEWSPSQVVRAVQSWNLRQAYPRAPPFRRPSRPGI